MKYFLALLLSLVHLISFSQENNTASNEKQVALTYVKEVLNKKKTDLLSTIVDPQLVFHSIDGQEIRIMKDSVMARFLKYLFNAFPDLHYTVDVAVAEGSDVAMYVTATGTHQNEFHGFPDSNKKITFKETLFSE